MKNLNSLFQISELIAKEKTSILSDSENATLKQWLSENPRNSEVYKKLQDENFLESEINELNAIDSHKAFIKVNRKIEYKPVKTFRLIPAYMKYAAAIAVLVVCSYVVFHLVNNSQPANYAQSTILPGKQRAILITANNQQIQLDSSNTKQIIINASANIVQTGSTLTYNKNDSINNSKAQLAYNTLITPLGGEYTLILSDGTKVMLNSGSKLKYPVVFAGITRQVELEGEAYFEVTKSQKSPFIVQANKVNVTVYGTVFNVMAYTSENQIQTTLIEGSIGVSIHNSKVPIEQKIKPGQQLTYNTNTESSETKEVDTDRYIAWTNGMFVFENEPIENILKVMSRWYNFEYEFKNENIKHQRFTISIGKYDKVSKILDLISASSGLKFNAKENTIIVQSN
jgi:transmembrane sensor